MSRKAFSLAVLGFVLIFSLSAVSLKSQEVVNSFDSVPMLQAHYGVESADRDDAFWDSCNVSLVTITSGPALYSWFGHAGFMVTYPDGTQIMYDYGTFSFNADNFIGNFIMGRLSFLCYSTYASYDIEDARETGRGVSLVDLPLTTDQKRDVICFLSLNSQRDYRTYQYHHYKDNCATRLRDIIDYTTGGQFKAWAQAQEGLSFRKQASRALSRNVVVQWVLEFLQSGNIDQDATLWEEMFLPENLEQAVMEFYGVDRAVLFTGTTTESPNRPQSNMLFSGLLGLALGLCAVLLCHYGKVKAFCIMSGVTDIVFGIFSSVLFFMMFFTNHDVTWMNQNILFANPLLFVLAVFSFLAIPKKGRTTDKKGVRRLVLCYSSLLVVMGILVILKSIVPSMAVQQNQSAIVTMLLNYLGCAVGCLRLLNN